MIREKIANSIEDTRKIAKEIVEEKRKVIALIGPIGAGKTTFSRLFCKYLGIEDVVSPTFSIVNEYEDKVVHIDLYRIGSVEELYDFDFEHYFFDERIVLIEWPEIALDLLPEDTFYIQIEDLGTQRRRFLMGGRDDLGI